MMFHLDYSYFLLTAGRFTQLILFSSFVIGCYFTWKMTYRISVGHDLIGMGATSMLFIALLLMAWGPDRITLFRVLVYFSLSVWVWYNVHYFTKYPIPAEYLKAAGRIALPTYPIFMPRWALFQYLYKSPTRTNKPWWFSATFRTLASAVGFVACMTYGCSSSINSYTTGIHTGTILAVEQVVQTKKELKKEVQQAVSSGVASATTTFVASVSSAVRQAAGPLLTNQDAILDKLAKSNKPLVSPTRSTAPERPNFYLMPRAQSIPHTDFKLPPAKVQSVPAMDKKGRKLSYQINTPAVDTLPNHWAKLDKYR